MSANRPKLAFSGDPSGPLATELYSYVELVPSDGADGADAEALLVDGQQSTPPDASTLEGVLNSGKLLAVASPSESLAQLLRELTGQGTGSGVPLITYKRSQGRAGYDCVLVPSSQFTGGAASESGPESDSTQSWPTELGAALVGALSPAAGGSAAMVTTILSTAGLIPPSGAMAGYSSFSSTMSWTVGYPSQDDRYDDKTVKTNTQTCPSQFLAEFFVYWVTGTGTGTAAPYYIVIQRQTGMMALGSMRANNSNSLGWFQLYFQLLPNSATNPNTNQPFTGGVSVLAHAPTTAAGGSVPVVLQEGMWLYAKTQSGLGPVQFNATVNDTLALPSWSVLDQTSANGTAWEFYQSSTWNPVTHPVSSFSSWWDEVYDDDDHVKQMPAASYGSIQFEAYTVWKFAEPLFTPPSTYPYNPPPSLYVDFSGAWKQEVALLHNPDGCSGAEGSTHHHVYYYWHSRNWTWMLDLGYLAQQQNIL